MANLPTLPTRTRVIDASNGNMTKPWLDFLQRNIATAQSGDAGWTSVTATGRTVTPDLSQALNQEITVMADAFIAAPINYTGSPTFRLILEQDATGGHALTFDSAYKDLTNPAAFSGANAPANTRVILTCTVRGDGSIIQTAPTIGPIAINS
jgi:hypothetical protein